MNEREKERVWVKSWDGKRKEKEGEKCLEKRKMERMKKKRKRRWIL